MTIAPTVGIPIDVPAPLTRPVRYGILDAALVIDDPSAHWQMGTQYQAEWCGAADSLIPNCMPHAVPAVERGDRAVRPLGTYQVALGAVGAPEPGGGYLPGQLVTHGASDWQFVPDEGGLLLTGIPAGSNGGLAMVLPATYPDGALAVLNVSYVSQPTAEPSTEVGVAQDDGDGTWSMPGDYCFQNTDALTSDGCVSNACVLDTSTGHIYLSVLWNGQTTVTVKSISVDVYAPGTDPASIPTCADRAKAGGGDAKTVHDGVDWVFSIPFAVYHLARCLTIGIDVQAYAIRALQLGEERAVSQAFMALLEGEAFGLTTDDLSAAAGSTLDVAEALGRLEAYACSHYGGLPTLIVPRSLVAILAARREVVRGDTGLETVLGTPVAAICDDTPYAPGDAVPMWITGQVVLRRGTPFSHVPQMPTLQNEVLALAERVYTASVECFVAKCEAKWDACCS